MKNNIYMFGDSYFEESYKVGRENTWPFKLRKKYEKDYNFYNFSLSGTGPHRSFMIFNDLLYHDKFEKNDIILFRLSSSDRIWFPDLPNDKMKKKGSSEIGYDLDTKEVYCTMTEKNVLNGIDSDIFKFYKLFNSEINFMFNTFHNELLYSDEKNISYLYSITKLYDLKIIVFHNGFDQNFSRMTELNDEKFITSEILLTDISDMEVKKEQQHMFDGSLVKDNRFNHLSLENHEIMLNYIINLISGNIVSSPVFKTNFKDYNEILETISKNSHRDFLYE